MTNFRWSRVLYTIEINGFTGLNFKALIPNSSSCSSKSLGKRVIDPKSSYTYRTYTPPLAVSCSTAKPETSLTPGSTTRHTIHILVLSFFKSYNLHDIIHSPCGKYSASLCQYTGICP